MKLKNIIKKTYSPIIFLDFFVVEMYNCLVLLVFSRGVVKVLFQESQLNSVTKEIYIHTSESNSGSFYVIGY